MALFKIFNNIDSKNENLPSTYTKGYMYYDAKKSLFYIDTAGTGGEIGTRQAINAFGAEKTLNDSLNQQIDTTYIKGISIANNQLSYVTGDGTSHTIEGTLGAVTGVKGDIETTYRTGQINLTPADIGAATSGHTHTTTIATDNGTNQLTLAFGTKYKLTAGGTSYIFTMPANPDTNTASAVDNILDGSNSGTAITYAPYTSQQAKLSFDTSTTNPARTDRLNLNGYLYATKLYSGGKEVLTAHQSLSNYKTKQTVVSSATAETSTATTFVYSVTQNDNGEITVKTRPLPTYNNYTLPKATDDALGGIKTGYFTSDKNYAIKVDTNGNAYVNVPWENTHQDISGKLDKSGGTMTGALKLSGDPTDNLHATTKQYVDNILNVANAVVFKGGIAAGDNLPAANCGDLYRVTSDGKINEIDVWVGDTLICTTDNTKASTPNNWLYLQTGDGTVIGPNESTAEHIATFTGTTGKAIQDSGKIITTSIDSNPDDTSIPTSKAVVDAFANAKVQGANLTTIAGSIAYYSDTNGTFASDRNLTWDSTNQTLTANKLKGYVVAGKKAGTTLGLYATAEGYQTTASGDYSHTEGYMTTASRYYSHAEGGNTTASGYQSHAEGSSTTASGGSSHAEGSSTTASGGSSHAEGYSTTASGYYSHAEGQHVIASGVASHAEGMATEICPILGEPTLSKVEGQVPYQYQLNTGTIPNQVNGISINHKLYSITAIDSTRTIITMDKALPEEGSLTVTGYVINPVVSSGKGSHAEGTGTIANHKSQHVFGECNIADDSPANADNRGNYVEIVGNGDSSARSNARTLDWNGNEVLAGKLTVGANPTENMDVATKQYVDNAFTGIADKATAANLTTTTNAIAKYSNTTGTFANSGVLIDDSNNLYPNTNNSSNIGTQTYGWKNIFLSTSSMAKDQGISFIESNTIKAKIGGSNDGGLGIYSTENKSIYLRPSLTNLNIGVVVKKSEVEFQAEDLKITKDSKSASIVFNSTTNALDFVFA